MSQYFCTTFLLTYGGKKKGTHSKGDGHLDLLKKKKNFCRTQNSQEFFHISAKALSKYISHVTSKRKHVSVSFCKADRSCLSHFNKIKGHQKWWEKNKPLWKGANSNAFTYKMVIYKIIFSKKCILRLATFPMILILIHWAREFIEWSTCII